jgi:hypothetical protein
VKKLIVFSLLLLYGLSGCGGGSTEIDGTFKPADLALADVTIQFAGTKVYLRSKGQLKKSMGFEIVNKKDEGTGRIFKAIKFKDQFSGQVFYAEITEVNPSWKIQHLDMADPNWKIQAIRLDFPPLSGLYRREGTYMMEAEEAKDSESHAALYEFKERMIGSELLNELIPSYNDGRERVNSKMTIGQVFAKYCGDAKIQWTVLPPEELEKSDVGVATGNAFKLMLSMNDKETLEKTRREINEKKYESEVYGIKVEVTKTYPVDRQKPEIRTYEEGFLFDRKDKKIKHLLLGLMNGISAIDFSMEAKGKKDWK